LPLFFFSDVLPQEQRLSAIRSTSTIHMVFLSSFLIFDSLFALPPVTSSLIMPLKRKRYHQKKEEGNITLNAVILPSPCWNINLTSVGLPTRISNGYLPSLLRTTAAGQHIYLMTGFHLFAVSSTPTVLDMRGLKPHSLVQRIRLAQIPKAFAAAPPLKCIKFSGESLPLLSLYH